MPFRLVAGWYHSIHGDGWVFKKLDHSMHRKGAEIDQSSVWGSDEKKKDVEKGKGDT